MTPTPPGTSGELKLESGKLYVNGHGDTLGPMEERTEGVWLDQHGGIYHPNGQQWNHAYQSAGNIKRELRTSGEAQWVTEMREHYQRTGQYRAEDITRLLGDTRKSFSIPARTPERKEAPSEHKYDTYEYAPSFPGVRLVNTDEYDIIPKHKEAPDEAGLRVQIMDYIAAQIGKQLDEGKAYECNPIAWGIMDIIRPHLAPDKEVLDTLAFYADADNYTATVPGMQSVIGADGGRRAEAILKARGR